MSTVVMYNVVSVDGFIADANDDCSPTGARTATSRLRVLADAFASTDLFVHREPEIGADAMTDNEHPAGLGRDADDSPTHAHVGWTGFLVHRWPTALGIAVAALTAFDLRIDAGSISFLSALVVLMPLVYVGAAVAGRRRFAWVVLLVAITPLVLTRVLDLEINLHPAFLVAALAFLALGAARGSSGVPLQAAGMLVFGAGMLVALYVEPVFGGVLVAAGLLGHAAWDTVHYVRNRVVTRPYAEFCAVLDLLVGAAVLFVLFRASW